MWGRWCEIALAVWLIASPWVLAGDSPPPANGVACGVLTLGLSSASFRHSWRRAHLALLPVACWMCAYGWLAARAATPAPPPAQNAIIVGLLLATFAIVPSDAAAPPTTWSEDRERAR